MMALQEGGTPVKTGVQVFFNHTKTLDSGACPGPDPGAAGMTEKRKFRLFARLTSSKSPQPPFIKGGLGGDFSRRGHPQKTTSIREDSER